VPASASAFPFRLEFPPELPISARAQEIADAIAANPVVILAGETGSGKTTQIPKLCLAAGGGQRGRIACTQPRRVAALSVSRRVAEELRVAWGREVGCKVRFRDETTSATVIKFLTDGMLLAEVHGDPLLREYDTIIVDEAHERSLNIDFLLGHLRQLRFRRPELKIVITSATIDTAAFSGAFDGAPVITVEGRMHPVEVIYAPLDSFGSDADPAAADPAEKAEALHYIDGAVEAVERILRDSRSGDILVFLPSERDIREVRELLEGRRGRECEVVSLFGRLTNDEQQRVFAPTSQRKIVVATNIAETSLTIPGIRFVVDTGLARVSRYSPTARTRRLPIEAVAQSSADQRKGRCGRVAEGVCIRLYSEADYLARPRFAAPEIQRANLADVILRLKAFGLGDIERFPFIDPPAPKAIRAGYALLEELGAIAPPPGSEPGAPAPEGPLTPTLTALGAELARLPVDPTVGRMILQARGEKAVREVLVIAAGLSIQDPRERPQEMQTQADAAHRRFIHPDSDFLTLLNIWEAYHAEFEALSQAKLRRFCRDHFLSYTRLREWRDVHLQLLEVLRERRDFQFTSVFDGVLPSAAAPDSPNARTAFGTPAYRAIHRSILSGLLGNVATRAEEGGGYRATHDRRVVLFPGSVLFRREPARRPAGAAAPKGKGGGGPPRWLMAAEIMETTRLYARTCARLDPAWALDLGAHLVRVAHSEPFWDADAGRVRVKQKTRLYGLEIDHRAVGYGRVNPAAATEIFIREALVNDSVAWPLDFLAHNRAVREGVAHALTRARNSGSLNLDEAVYRFYAARLTLDEVGPTGLSSVAELVDWVRERRAAQPRLLFLSPADLHDPETVALDPADFPAELPLENRAIPLNYAYRPGQEDDGVTLEVDLRDAEALTPAALDWAVPGHLEPKVEHYLRALPKELRRTFVPLADNAKRLAETLRQRDRLTGRRETIAEALAAELRERFRLVVDPSIWAAKPPPEHLRVRVRVRDAADRPLAASRELGEIAAALLVRGQEASARLAHEDPEGWRRARAQWEKPPQTSWTFGDLPIRVPVADQAGLTVFAFPGLQAGADGVALRLFRAEGPAREATALGLAALLELGLKYELSWLQRDLRGLRELGALSAPLEPLEDLQEESFASIRAWACAPERVVVSASGLSAAGFTAARERAQAELKGLVPRWVDLLRQILTLRQELLVHPQPYAGLEGDLADLISPGFIWGAPFGQLAQFPRYLRARKLRADRWRKDPVKDADRARQLAPYVAAEAKRRVQAGGRAGPLRWAVEEFRVSLFAQELGTAQPVSAVKLDRMLEQADTAPEVVAPPPPRPAAKPPGKADKSTLSIKSFGSLDKLFPR
jgi:ATP-dependent helicase HrpA